MRRSELRTYLIVERFRKGAEPVYERFQRQGRLAPTGLEFEGSWISTDLERCYQVMRTADRTLLERWMDRWRDLVDFEVIEVVDSETAKRLALGEVDAE